jgi:hypothetical protein
MAYENYSFVFWTPATPITADRLSQMSTNTDQVKAATDDNPKGIIKIKTISGSTFGPYSDFDTEHELIALENESNGPNNTISVAINRYYKVSLSFPGISIFSAGGEDCTFLLTLNTGTPASPVVLTTWKLTPPTYTFIDNATLPNNTNLIKIKTTNSFPTRVGAGTYTTVLDTGGTAISGQRMFASINRDNGSSSNNASSFSVVTSGCSMQLYVEDVGGTV